MTVKPCKIWLQTKRAGWRSFNDWNEQEKMSGFAILADWVLSIALKHCHIQKHIVISVCYVMAQYLSWKSPLWQHRTFTQVQNFFCLKSLIYALNAQTLLRTCAGLYLHRFIWPRRAKTLSLTSICYQMITVRFSWLCVQANEGIIIWRTHTAYVVRLRPYVLQGSSTHGTWS